MKTCFRNEIYYYYYYYPGGYYIYLEASSGRLNYKARLVSPRLQKAASSCFSFWYNMYGAYVNTLNFYISNTSSIGTNIWTLKGTQGPEWHYDHFTVPANTAVVRQPLGVGVGVLLIVWFKTHTHTHTHKFTFYYPFREIWATLAG